jgi:hypothetical protein
MSRAKDSGSIVPEGRVRKSPDGAVELSEAELDGISGGGKSQGGKPKSTKGTVKNETSDYLVVRLTDASVMG